MRVGRVGAILGVAAIAGWVVVSGTGPSAAAGTERAVRCHGLVATVVTCLALTWLNPHV